MGELLRYVTVVIKIIAMRVQVIEAKAKFVDQVWPKPVDLAGREAFGILLL